MRERVESRGEARRNSLVSIALALALPTSASTISLGQTANVAQGEQPQVHRNFQEVSTGRAVPSKGAREASVHSYKSEGGTVVQLREWYKSDSDASSALDIFAKKATRVIKQGTKKGAEGRVIGKRVELVFSLGGKGKQVIAWTDGATIVRLSSTSLPLLLDFESQYYP